MRIGVLPAPSPGGGVYQYSLTMLRALGALAESTDLVEQIVVFTQDAAHLQSTSGATGPRWQFPPPAPPTAAGALKSHIVRFVGTGRARQAWWRVRQRLARNSRADAFQTLLPRPELGAWFRRWGVDLMVYPYDATVAPQAGIPYIFALHDVAHRLHPEFHELSDSGDFEVEQTRRLGSVNARVVLADSELGRRDILDAYGHWGLDANRVRVLPFVPPPYLRADVPIVERQRVRVRYGLPERFVFYPADFSPHKNHVQLVRALSHLRDERQMRVPAVFCGYHSDLLRTDWLRELQSLVRRHRLESQVHFVGYVPEEDISALYASAAMLAMPTYVGPTVIPVLEAWATRCPVLTSDIRGLREQVGDAGLLVDPRSFEAIADAIHALWTDTRVCASLVSKGAQRLESYTFKTFCATLAGILGDISDAPRAWW
jgi:glycosyltransferase involved in cell wall biosynthesis